MSLLINNDTDRVGVDVAFLPDGTTPIEINTINSMDNPTYFIDNSVAPGLQIAYDGLTVALQTKPVPVTAGEATTLELVIADRGDSVYDSAVYINSQSIGTLFSLVVRRHISFYIII